MSTHNIHFQYKIEHHPKLIQICSCKIFFPGGLKKEFETAMVNEPSVFVPSKFYCITVTKIFKVNFTEIHDYLKHLTGLFVRDSGNNI